MTVEEELIQHAWGIIANAPWETQTDEWMTAAKSWRSQFHKWLDEIFLAETDNPDANEPIVYDLENLHDILENEWINTMFDLADEEERVSPHPHWRGDVHYIEGKLDALNSVLNKIERLIVLNNGTYYPGPRETVADDAT